MSTKTPTPALRREVALAKPIVQGGKRYEPNGDEKPRLTERQIARLTESGHLASTPATGGATKRTAKPQEG